MSDKYESLKKRFAVLAKEKELAEKTRFQETAKFKDGPECSRCAKWRGKTQ